MLFDLNSIFLFGLIAVATAAPANNLETRANRKKIPEYGVQCDSYIWTKNDIASDLKRARENPTYASNYNNIEQLFGSSNFKNVDISKTGFRERGKYRLVFTKDYSYIGLIKHISGNSFNKCGDVTPPPPPANCARTVWEILKRQAPKSPACRPKPRPNTPTKPKLNKRTKPKRRAPTKPKVSTKPKTLTKPKVTKKPKKGGKK